MAESYDEVTSHVLLLGILLPFTFIGVVLILNLLIAVVSDTYSSIQENSDQEWKFIQAELLKVRK